MYQSWAIQGAEEMVVVEPPMTIGEMPLSTVALLAADVDGLVTVPEPSSVAMAATTRFSSSAREGAFAAVLFGAFGSGATVAAFADVASSAAATATGSAIRTRRL
ncbi:hypothetical protein [Streptomyces sp. SID13726]|uniref:hypothetical protein n=1 Tax=Streptomyces sp. SID13726 TaxID=2706058 RepID=UPI0031BAF125